MRNRFFLFLITFFCSAAQAGILIEPYVGGSANTMTAEWASPSAVYDMTGTGTYVGGRLGYKFIFGLWVAGDYTSNSTTYTVNKPAGLNNVSINSTFTFIDAGWDLPFLFRVYGGYGVSGSASLSATNIGGDTYSDKFTGGTAVKAGLGVSFIHFLSINVEYFKPTFSRYESVTNGVSAGEQDLSAAWRTMDLSTTALTLSFPLSLF